MSDNLLLTVLGAVGVGALVMGMNQSDVKKPLKEEFVQGYSFGRYMANEIGEKDGCQLSSVNFAQNPGLQRNIQEVARMNNQGVPQASQVARLQSQSTARASQQMSQLAKSVGPQVENFVSPSQLGLGSGAVTRNDYVSYPQFNQSNPLQSPSLNLPAQIRYNPPSLNNMGITNAYQSEPMDYASLVEGYTNVATYEKNPEGVSKYGGQVNAALGNVTNSSNYLNTLKSGTASFASDKEVVQGTLPLSTMDSLAPENPAAQNIYNYDRFVYSTGKLGGHRSNTSGGADMIRGDLAVCVDPCQKGWFQSSAQPKDLRTGALQVIAGPSVASSNSDVQNFARQYGNRTASTGLQGQSAKLSVLQTALAGSPNNIVSLTSFA